MMPGGKDGVLGTSLHVLSVVKPDEAKVAPSNAEPVRGAVMIAGVIKSQPAGDARIMRSVERLLRDLQVVAREPRVVMCEEP